MRVKLTNTLFGMHVPEITLLAVEPGRALQTGVSPSHPDGGATELLCARHPGQLSLAIPVLYLRVAGASSVICGWVNQNKIK